MKKSFVFLICSVFAVCTSGYAQTKKAGTGAKPASGVLSPADIAQGKALITKSDCFACHKPTEKLVGPAYSEVAKKYPATQANVTMLAKKVIKGGSGVWGEIPMAPHPSVTQADAEKIVKYILSTK
nr:c-type cytochrome [Pedobacter panaciterrae]